MSDDERLDPSIIIALKVLKGDMLVPVSSQRLGADALSQKLNSLDTSELLLQ